MRSCPSCGRRYPEVVGADVQRCPFCGEETASGTAEETPSASAPLVDPVAATAHAARFARRHYPKLLLLWVPVVLADLAAALAVVAYQEATGLHDVGNLTQDQALSFLGVALPLYFLDFAVTFAGWGLVAAAVLDADGLKGGGNVRALLRRAPGALAMGALLTFALLAGFVLLVVPFLVMLHFFVFAPAAFAAGARMGESFDESRRFGRERRTYGFTALVLLALVLAIGLQTFLAWGLAEAAQGMGARSAYALALLEIVPSWLLSPLVPLLPASYWAIASRPGAAPAATEPRPGAARAGDTRTTKCPRCSALIAYRPTGAPVEVRCPSCGASGRVL